MYKTDYKYFNKARQAATFSDYHKTHIGCIAVYQNHIIGIGYNCNKTHPVQNMYNRYRITTNSNYMPPKLHAEINCIKNIASLDLDFSKIKLYIYRIRKDQPYGLARPCKSCTTQQMMDTCMKE